MTTGRLPAITEDPDSRALIAALNNDGILPAWTEDYSRAAFAHAGYLDPDQPDRLSPLGVDTARDWAAVKALVSRGWRTDGPLTP